MTHPQLLAGLKCESQTENNGRTRSRSAFLGSQHYRGVESQHYRGVEGRVRAPGEGLGRCDKLYSLTRTCTKRTPSGQCIVGALLVLGRATGNLDTQDSPRPGLEGSHHLPPYSILCVTPWGQHPNGHFVPRLPSGSPEIPSTGIPATLRAHNFLCRPPIAMRSEAKLYPSSRAFQRYVASCLHARKSGRFLTFSGRESNCQFDSQPFFWP